jgi:hypothetical protein
MSEQGSTHSGDQDSVFGDILDEIGSVGSFEDTDPTKPLDIADTGDWTSNNAPVQGYNPAGFGMNPPELSRPEEVPTFEEAASRRSMSNQYSAGGASGTANTATSEAATGYVRLKHIANS